MMTKEEQTRVINLEHLILSGQNRFEDIVKILGAGPPTTFTSDERRAALDTAIQGLDLLQGTAWARTTLGVLKRGMSGDPGPWAGGSPASPPPSPTDVWGEWFKRLRHDERLKLIDALRNAVPTVFFPASRQPISQERFGKLMDQFADWPGDFRKRIRDIFQPEADVAEPVFGPREEPVDIKEGAQGLVDAMKEASDEWKGGGLKPINDPALVSQPAGEADLQPPPDTPEHVESHKVIGGGEPPRWPATASLWRRMWEKMDMHSRHEVTMALEAVYGEDDRKPPPRTA